MNKRRHLNRAQAFLISLAVLLLAVAAAAAPSVLRMSGEQGPDTMRELFLDIYTDVQLSGMCNYLQFNYAELTSWAHTIAVVTPLDDLTTENSYGISESGDRFYNAHSVREVQLVEVFKNEKGYKDTMKIAEKCVVLEDGTLVAEEACYPMQRGDYYLVFLFNSGYGYPLSLSADNGKYDLTHLRLNNRQHLLVEMLYDLGLAESAGLRARNMDFLADFTKPHALCYKDGADYASLDARTDWSSLPLTTRYTDSGMTINLEYAENTEGIMAKLGDYIYQAG